MLMPMLFADPKDEGGAPLMLETNVGNVLLLFKTEREFKRFQSALTPRLAAGERLGATEMPTLTASDIERDMQKFQPPGAPPTTYIAEGDPRYGPLMESVVARNTP